MTSAPGELDPDDYVGLPGERAGELATERGWLARVVPPGSMMTMDFREDRLNLLLDDDGTVVRAYPG